MKLGSMEDVLLDAIHCREQGCYNFTKNGKCSKCGNCCSALLPLSQTEINRLKKIIKSRNIKEHKQPVIVQALDLTCPFLTDDNLCQIYADRPLICKAFKCDSKPTEEDFRMIKEPLIPTNVRDLFKG